MSRMPLEIPAVSHTINGRRSMRSIADATEALRSARCLKDDQYAEVWARPFFILHTGEHPSFVLVWGGAAPGEPRWNVTLPTSAHFRAREPGGSLSRHDVRLLDGAKVTPDNVVELADGRRFIAVDLVPTCLPLELTPLQKRILYWTIKMIDAEDLCYGGAAPNLELKYFDYSRLHGLECPKLNEIQHFIAKHDWTLKRISHQSLANALGACGLRRPRSGRAA